jgi:hypothetical protein
VTALLLVIGGAIIWLLAFSSRDVPPLRFIGIGIGAYDHLPPNAGGRQDVVGLRNWFRQLHDAYPANYRPVVELDDTLTGTALLTQVTEQLATASEENLLVYCTAHGFVGPSGEGTVQLFAIHAGLDAVRGGGTAEVISFRNLLDGLQNSPARRILLCVDVGRLDPEWRLGIVAEDAQRQLLEEIQSFSSEKLTVLLSCGSNERSQVVRESQTTRSLFGMALEAALRGDGDGSGPLGMRDGVLSCQELADYVINAVGRSAKQQRGVEQTVTLQGNRTDFSLLTLRNLPASSPADAPEPASPPAPDATAASTAAGAAHSPDANHEKNPPANSTTKTPPPVSHEAIARRLLEFWTRRDAMRRSQQAVAWTPHTWMTLQSALLRAEEDWQAGYLDASQQMLNVAEEMLKIIETQASPKTLGEQAPWSEASLAWAGLVGENIRTSAAEDQAISQVAREIISRANAEPPTASGSTNKQNAATAPVPPQLNTPVERRKFAAWIIAQAQRPDGPSLAELSLLLRELSGKEWPAAEWPIELDAIFEVTQRVADHSITDENLARNYIRTRNQWQSLLALPGPHEEFTPLLCDQLRLAGQAIVASERWLAMGPPGQESCRLWLQTAGDRIRELQQSLHEIQRFHRLRDTLLAELPGTAYWVANLADEDRERTFHPDAAARMSQFLLSHDLQEPGALESLQAQWPARGGPLDIMEQQLLHAFFGARQLNGELLNADSHLPSPHSEVIDRLSRECSQIEKNWEELQRSLRNEVDQLLRLREPGARDVRRATIALHSPWIEADNRRRLWSLVATSPVRPAPKIPARSGPVSPDGFWNSFWEIQTVCLAGLEASTTRDLWTAWEPLSLPAEPDDRQPVIRRARLGGMLNRIWSELPSGVSGTAASSDSRLRIVNGWDHVPSVQRLGLDQAVQSRGRKAWQAIVQGYADVWSLNGHHSATQQSLAARLKAIDISFSRDTEPHFTPVEDVVCDLNRQGHLNLTWEGNREDVHVSVTGAGVRAVESHNEGEPGRSTQHRIYELQLDRNVREPQGLIVGLLGENDFPFDLKEVRVLPALDPARWRIEFATTAGHKPIHQVALEKRFGTRISLPPEFNGALTAELVRPPEDLVKMISVQAFAISGDGERFPLSSNWEIAWQSGQTRAPLAPPASEGAAGAAPTSVNDKAVDASQGLVFRILPDRDEAKAFEYFVEPEFWPATEFVVRPVPLLRNSVLTVPVVRQVPGYNPEQEDWLVPEEIPVALTLSSALNEVVSGQGVLGNPKLKIGEPPVSLFVKLDERALARLQQGGDRSDLEFSLSVAGWTHPFRWRIDGKGIDTVPPAGGASEVRIASPLQDAVYLKKPKAPGEPIDAMIPVRLEIYAPSLDFARQYDRGDWRLLMDVRTAQARQSGQELGIGRTWNLTASTLQRMTAKSGADGAWVLVTSVGDFETELPVRDFGVGRYELVGRLLRNQAAEGPDRIASFAIDDSPPEISVVPQASGTTHFLPQPLKVQSLIRDPESGPASLTIGLDLNGNGAIDDDEPHHSAPDFAQRLGPIEQTVTVTFGNEELPKQPGKVSVLALGTNRAGLLSQSKLLLTLTGAATMPAPTTGKIVVQTKGTGNIELQLLGPQPAGPIALKRGATHTFEGLPPGSYTVKWRAYLREGTSGAMQVGAGDVKAVAVP